MKLTKCNQWVYDYLVEGDWISPTQVGRAYGVHKHGIDYIKSGYHSAWGSPRCLHLMSLGLIERSDRGWYRKRKIDPEHLNIFWKAEDAVITGDGTVWVYEI